MTPIVTFCIFFVLLFIFGILLQRVTTPLLANFVLLVGLFWAAVSILGVNPLTVVACFTLVLVYSVWVRTGQIIVALGKGGSK